MYKRIMVVVALSWIGCDGRDAKQPAAAAPAATVATTAAHANPRARAEHGRKLFVAWCSGCHGERGLGDGPAAAVLIPKPRNFVRHKFKIRSTPSASPPTRQDLLATVERGLPGTAMPSFKFLPEEERGLIVDHVRSLAGLDTQPEPTPIVLSKEPGSSAESIARGKLLYVKFGCVQCHGAEGRGDGPASNTLKNDLGEPIPARDYSKGLYLGGDSPEAVHMRFRTGLDGTGMPSFGDSLQMGDGWDLTYFVLSLRKPKPPLPSDLVARGQQVVEDKQCFACHVINGKGGDVGPSLDVASQKLRWDWLRTFLEDPLKPGKIYPYMPYRMPPLGLTAPEIDGVVALLAKNAHRAVSETSPPTPTFDPKKVADGQLLYFLKCTECHNLGKVIPNPVAKQVGPDLINVTRRIELKWIPTWVNNPKSVYPNARMVDTNLTPSQIEAVTAFVWKTSADAQTIGK